MVGEGSKSNMSTDQKIVLIVDDDPPIGEMLEEAILEHTDYQVMWVAESDLALNVAPHLRPSLILLDYMLPSMDGLKLYDRLQEIENMRGVPVVLISAWDTLPFEEIRSRNIHLLKKPFGLDELLDILAQLLSAH